jgi:hypothetical protein
LVRPAPARPVARPATRPPSSRPGRVQVNPPGTHGGLTAPPSPTAGAEPAGAGQGMGGHNGTVGQSQGAAARDPDDLERLLHRRAVGH